MGWEIGWGMPPVAPPRPRHRPSSTLAVQRPLLKHVMLTGGPLDKKVIRIPREHNGIASSDHKLAYRDSGAELDGYPRFDHVILGDESASATTPA